MNVTIIGAGNMGRAIGTRAVAGGHAVEIVDRNPEDAQALAEELGATAVPHDGELGGDVVVLALYYPSIPEAVEQYGAQLAGKTVVDICLPLDWDTMDGFVVPSDSSGGQEVQKLLPDSKVVKAFCTSFAPTLVAGEKNGVPLDVPIAGDDEEARQQVATIVEDGAMRPIQLGPLRRAQQMEHAMFFQIVARQALEAESHTALKILD